MPFPFLPTDRRLVLLSLSALLAILLGFVVVKGPLAMDIVNYGGYWAVLATFCLFLWSLWECYGSRLAALRFRQIDWVVAFVVLGCGTFLVLHESKDFKILMDEVLLSSTSMSMHYDRTVSCAVRGNDLNGVFMFVEGHLDKRPLFFPFLVSLVHDFTGYRVANAFALNVVLLFVFLAGVSWVGARVAGRSLAIFSVLLFTGLPLLAQNANGGGFELLNMVMVVTTLILAAHWLERRDGASLTALCCSAVLLVQVRYESALLALPVVLVILWVWFVERRLILDTRVCLLPLLLVPYALHLQVFSSHEDTWQLQSKPDFSEPFSLVNIPDNLVHAMNFYFSPPSEQPNSLVFSVLGWIAVPFAILFVFRMLRTQLRVSALQIAMGLFSVGFLAHFVLMMAYFWGQFDDPIIRRLSLPSHIWLWVSLVLVFPEIIKSNRWRWGGVGIVAVGLVGLGAPAIAKHAYTETSRPVREARWRIDQIKAGRYTDYLMIDNDGYLWLIHKVSATTVANARKNPDKLQFHLRNHTFSNIFVYQHIVIDPATGVMSVRTDDDLGSDYELEAVAEQRLDVSNMMRISRVVGVSNNGTLQKAGELRVVEKASLSELEEQRLNQQYMQNIYRRLP